MSLQNFDFTHAAFKNLDEVLPRLFGGENSIDFKLLTITGTARGEVTEDNESAKSATGIATGTLTAVDDGDPLTPPPVIEFVGDDDGDGVVEGTYGTMTFNVSSGGWTYTLDNMRPETQLLKAGQQETETFTFTADGTIFTVTITVNGADNKPVANTEFFEASGQVGQEITIDPNTLFNDIEGEELELTFTVMLLADDSTREELSTIGLSYNSVTKMITGIPTKSGIYTIEVAASYSDGAKDDIVTTFGITVSSVAPLADILGYLGKPIEAINLGNLFTDLDVATLTVTILDSSGSEVNINSIGLSYDDGTRMLTGTPTTTGAYTIKIVSSDGQDEIIFDFVLSAPQPPTLTGYVGQSTEIDLDSFITDPDNVTLTVTFLNSNGDEVDIGLRYTVTTEIVTDETTGLKTEKTTRAITGVPTSETGTYTLKIVATDSTSGAQENTFTFDFMLSELQPPTLTFATEQDAADADFTTTEDTDQPTNPIGPIDLSVLFADVEGSAVVVTLENGDALDTVGLSYDPATKMITGTPTAFGTHTITASGTDSNGDEITEEFIITAGLETPAKIIQIDDPNVLTDNPHESSRNQVGIRVGAKGGSATDVATARTDLKSDYDDSDVSVFAPTDTTDAEEEYVVEGEYGRFIVTRMRGEDTPDGDPAELRYYYERYQDGDENYKNINALGAGEIAYDVLTIWAFDGLTDAELAELTVMGGPHEIPQSAIDRRVFKTVVVEITGANDAPEVVSEIFNVLFTDSQAVSIDIDPANFFDVDGDTLTITVTLDDDSALSTIGLAYDPATGKITGTPNAAGPHTIKVTAEDGNGGAARYTFILSTEAANVNTEPVVEISGTQTLVLIDRIPVASDSDTGFDITYSDADDAHLDNDEVIYNFYQVRLVRDENGDVINTIRIRPADNLLGVSEDGSILLKAGIQFISDLSFEVVATDGEGSKSAPQVFTIIIDNNPAPILILAGLDGVGTVLGNTDDGRLSHLIIENTDVILTSESFTITGDQAEKFIVKKDDDGLWYLFLKDDESLDQENIEGTILDLDITVSVSDENGNTLTSNAVDIVVNTAREYFFDRGDRETYDYENVVYQARAEGDAEGTRYSIKPRIGDADLFIIDGDDGEVRFKFGLLPAAFDVDKEFNFIIIERSGGDVTETVVTLYNNAPGTINTSGAGSTLSPDKPIGFRIGADVVTAEDPDGSVTLAYYWFADNRPFGERSSQNLERLVNGEIESSVSGLMLTPLEVDNSSLLLLKGEYAEKEIWLVIAATDSEGHTVYLLLQSRRFDIADTRQKAIDGGFTLADIGIGNSDGNGNIEMVGDIGNSDNDWFSFIVEEGQSVTVTIDTSGNRDLKFRILKSSETEKDFRNIDKGGSASEVITESGLYFFHVSQLNNAGLYTVTFEGIDDKPTNLLLGESIEIVTLDTDLSQGMKVGVLTITDDIYGSNTIILTGANAELFEIRNTSDRSIKELWLKAGADLGALRTTLEVIASLEGTGKGSNPDVDLVITVTATDEDIPISITGARGAADTTETRTTFVLSENGRLILPDGTDAGVITIVDTKTATNQIRFATRGVHGGLFEIVLLDHDNNANTADKWVLRLKASAAALPSGSNYTITIVATDTNDDEFMLDLRIEQRGLYIHDAADAGIDDDGLSRVFTDGKALIEENTDGSSGTPIIIGALRSEITPKFIAALGFELIAGEADNDQFVIEKNDGADGIANTSDDVYTLKFIGPNSGDADSATADDDDMAPNSLAEREALKASSFSRLLDFSNVDITVKFSRGNGFETSIILPEDFKSGDTIWIRFNDTQFDNVKGVEVVISVSDDGRSLIFTPTGAVKLIHYTIHVGGRLSTEEIYQIDFTSEAPVPIRDGTVTLTVSVVNDTFTSDTWHITRVLVDGAEVVESRLLDNIDTKVTLGETNYNDPISLANMDIAARFDGLSISSGNGFETSIILPEDFNPGDTIWIRFNDTQYNNVKGIEVVISLGDDGTSLIFRPTGRVKLIDYLPEDITLTTEEIYQIDFTSETPAAIRDGTVTFTVRDATFTSANWHISHILINGAEVVKNRLQDNIDTKVILGLGEINYNNAINLMEFAPLSVVADEGGSAGNTIRVFVQIGTTANPTTGAKGVESVSVVDNVITVVTYSEGARWQQVADAINDDSDAGALVDVEATPATAESDVEEVDLFLSGGADAGPDVLNIGVLETYLEEKTHEETVLEDGVGSFVGTKDIDASGDTTDEDTRIFALIGGGIRERDFIYQDLLDDGETQESLEVGDMHKASSFSRVLDFSNIDITAKFSRSGGFETNIILPDDFKLGDTIWIRFNDSQFNNVKGVEVAIRLDNDGTSLIFRPTGRAKLIDYLSEETTLTTEEIYQIDFASETPAAIRDGTVTFTVRDGTFTSENWYITRILIDGITVVKSPLLDNIDTKITLSETDYNDPVSLANIDITVKFNPRGGFETKIILPDDFNLGDTIWIRFNHPQFSNVKGVEVAIRRGDDNASLIFTATGAVKLIEYNLNGGTALTTEEIYQIDFTSEAPAAIRDGAITFTVPSRNATFTSQDWHITRILIDGITVVKSRLLDNIDTKVVLGPGEINYNNAISLAEFAPLSIVADEDGLTGNTIRVFVQIGTAANPTTGEKGVESVSVVDNVITVVTYSDGARWQQVADAINGDNDAGALVDVVATPATAESDAEAVGLYLEGGEIIVPPLEENANARLINVEGGWIYPGDGKAIRFEAVFDLRVDLSTGEAQIIVVPTGVDANGVRIGEVRLLASSEDKPDEYYVIGTTGTLGEFPEIEAATAVLAIDGVEYLRFISEKTGTEGNGQEIQFVFQDSSVVGIFSGINDDGVIVIMIPRTLTRDDFSDGYDSTPAVDNLIDLEFIGAFKDTGFFNESKFDDLFDDRSITLTLSGGREQVQTAPTPATGTEVTTPEVLTWQKISTKTHEYQINLDNIDDNGPVFGEARGFEVTAATAASLGIKGASDDGQGTVINAKVTDVVEDQDLIITAKTVGSAGALITIQFETGSTAGRGVESITVTETAIKFVLKADGAMLSAIKAFLDDDASAGVVAARALIEITIASGKDALEIGTPIPATALSGSTETHGEASIDENNTDPGVIFQVSASDADGDVVTYSLDDDFGLFEIDTDTGEITLITGESADFEATPSYTLQVIATSSL